MRIEDMTIEERVRQVEQLVGLLIVTVDGFMRGVMYGDVQSRFYRYLQENDIRLGDPGITEQDRRGVGHEKGFG